LDGLAETGIAYEPALALQPGQIQLRPLPVVLHASDKGIKREPYGLSGPPNLSEKDSELLEHAAVAVVELDIDFQGLAVVAFCLLEASLLMATLTSWW
jgi:hypothetical protein